MATASRMRHRVMPPPPHHLADRSDGSPGLPVAVRRGRDAAIAAWRGVPMAPPRHELRWVTADADVVLCCIALPTLLGLCGTQRDIAAVAARRAAKLAAAEAEAAAEEAKQRRVKRKLRKKFEAERQTREVSLLGSVCVRHEG